MFVSCFYFHCYTATSDLQSAQVVFFENNIYLSCVLARNSPAVGCSIRLTLATNTNDTQPDATFDLLRNEVLSNTDVAILSNCTMSTNQKAAYDEERVVSVAIREDDVLASVIVPVTLSEEGSADNFTRITNCTLPQQGQNMYPVCTCVHENTQAVELQVITINYFGFAPQTLPAFQC